MMMDPILHARIGARMHQVLSGGAGKPMPRLSRGTPALPVWLLGGAVVFLLLSMVV